MSWTLDNAVYYIYDRYTDTHIYIYMDNTVDRYTDTHIYIYMFKV